jgi:uncharacterized protein YpmS
MTDGFDKGSSQAEAKPKAQPNPWKRAFWMLAFANIGILLILFVLILLPAGSTAPSLTEHSPRPLGAEPHLTITATAADLDGVVNRILADRQHENLRYRIEFGDPLRITGTLIVFGHGIELEARFRPEVLESGDLLLVTDGMRIGLLPAPARKILSYVRTYYELPDWVSIEDGGNRVALYLTRMNAGNGMELRVLDMDAEADRYRFAWAAKSADQP